MLGRFEISFEEEINQFEIDMLCKRLSQEGLLEKFLGIIGKNYEDLDEYCGDLEEIATKLEEELL